VWVKSHYGSELEFVTSNEDLGAVIHLGALASTRIKDKKLLYGFNHEAVISIANFCLERQLPLTFISSSAIYGNSGKNLSEYAKTKLLAEEYLRSREDLDCNIVRLFNTFGFNEIKKESMKSIVSDMIISAITTRKIEIWKIPKLGFGEQSRDLIFVEDVANSLLNLSIKNCNLSKTIDLGSGKSTKFIDLATLIADQGTDVEIIPKHLPSDYNLDSYQIYTRADTDWKESAPELLPDTKISEVIPKLFTQYKNVLIP